MCLPYFKKEAVFFSQKVEKLGHSMGFSVGSQTSDRCFSKIRVALNDSKGLLSLSNVLPSLPRLKLLGFSLGKSLQSFREGKLIFLTKIVEYHYKLNLIY
jgi:hypothetical protein